MLGAATASALSLSAPARADTATETVVVTGSRIPQVGIYSSSPVTALGDHELKLEGTTSISGALQTLPSVVNDGDGNSVNNGTAGIATVDLRNLGTKRTLILVDGKRLVASDPSLDVDTNQIPAAMVERIEVLTGGASAVYGSDAVAGVVNIILKKDFEGLTFDTQFSSTDSSDGQINDSSFLMGLNSGDGKGNLTIYGEYAHRDGVLGSQRDFSQFALAATNYTGCAASEPATHFGGFCHSGSGSIREGRITTASPANAVFGPTAGKTTMFTAGGGIAIYDKRTYNFAPYQYLQTPGQRYAFGASGHYQITSGIDFYTRLTFSDNSSDAQLAPSPMTKNFNINCGNPLMSGAVRQAIFGTNPAAGPDGTDAGRIAQCATISPLAPNLTVNAADATLTTRLVGTARRLVENGPRASNFDHSSYQMVLGARGGLGYGWNYDVSAQYGHATAAFVLKGDAQATNFQNGLLVSSHTGLCTIGGTCSPLNFFTPAGLTAANVSYITENLLENTFIDQWDVQATATGDLGFVGLQSPWAKEPIGAAFGVEYRQEKADFEPDNNLRTNNLVGFQAAVPTKGGFNVAEGFMEFRVPIIEDMPLFQSLQLNLAYRYDHYNLSGDAHSYNVGIEWQPVEDLRFRGSFQRAVRAPNVSELFTPAGGTSANAGRDPCSANSATPTTAALCIATGVPAASVFTVSLNCPTNQCQAAVGGNPFLKPETSDSWTLGVVLTPTFIPGFSMTLDYYNIKIGGFITATPIQSILNGCYSTALNPTQSAANPNCTFVHRDSLGTIITGAGAGYVVSAEGNIGGDKVQGFDAELNYDLDLNDIGFDKAGSLALNAVGTLVTVNNTELADGTILHCAGVWGTQCGEPENRFKSNVRLTWTDNKGDFSLSLRWRHLTGVEFEGNLPGTVAPGFAFHNTPTLEFPAFDYFDLSGTWAVADAIDLRAGVRNIFDKDPPITDNNTAPASDVNNNTFPNTYDALGRIIFVGATIKL